MENYTNNQIIPLSNRRIEKYLRFLHEFEELNESKKKGFVSKLIKFHAISAPTLIVMKDIGMLTGNGHKGYKIHYHMPAEPITVRRILMGLYHYNKLAKEDKTGSNTRQPKDREKLLKVMEQYSNKKIEALTPLPLKSTYSSNKPPEPEKKFSLDISDKKRKYKRKSKIIPKVVEIRSFGILWYKRIETKISVEIIICWIPVYYKKVETR